jgi:3',5'-cyclic AMP phosphodiesterase CpdA
MERRNFIKNLAEASVLPFLLSCGSEEKGKEEEKDDSWSYSHSNTSLETIIVIKSLKTPFTVLQISDSHVSCDNESDVQYEQYSKRMRDGYATSKHYKTGKTTTPLDCFTELMQFARLSKVDMIALTGDIINYPSATAVERILQLVNGAGVPWFYTAGNHDWHYEGWGGSDDAQRAEWCEARLKPLYQGKNCLYGSVLLNGVNLVAIDNSTYQVNEEQLEFYKQQIALPEPVALFVHIPIYMPDMAICCGHPDWGAAADTTYLIERRERWSAEGNRPSTVEFLNQISRTEKLAGVFSGHWHAAITNTNREQVQDIAGAACDGRYRLIKFRNEG